MITASRFLMNGGPSNCAHCREPFPIRDGHAEAVVGPHGLLYCHGTMCVADAMMAEAMKKKAS